MPNRSSSSLPQNEQFVARVGNRTEFEPRTFLWFDGHAIWTHDSPPPRPDAPFETAVHLAFDRLGLALDQDAIGFIDVLDARCGNDRQLILALEVALRPLTSSLVDVRSAVGEWLDDTGTGLRLRYAFIVLDMPRAGRAKPIRMEDRRAKPGLDNLEALKLPDLLRLTRHVLRQLEIAERRGPRKTASRLEAAALALSRRLPEAVEIPTTKVSSVTLVEQLKELRLPSPLQSELRGLWLFIMQARQANAAVLESWLHAIGTIAPQKADEGTAIAKSLNELAEAVGCEFLSPDGKVLGTLVFQPQPSRDAAGIYLVRSRGTKGHRPARSLGHDFSQVCLRPAAKHAAR